MNIRRVSRRVARAGAFNRHAGLYLLTRGNAGSCADRKVVGWQPRSGSWGYRWSYSAGVRAQTWARTASMRGRRAWVDHAR